MPLLNCTAHSYTWTSFHRRVVCWLSLPFLYCSNPSNWSHKMWSKAFWITWHRHFIWFNIPKGCKLDPSVTLVIAFQNSCVFIALQPFSVSHGLTELRLIDIEPRLFFYNLDVYFKMFIMFCAIAAKNGVYITLVRDVRHAFEGSPLVKIDCRGMHASDYKKLGAKLKVCMPLLFLQSSSCIF